MPTSHFINDCPDREESGDSGYLLNGVVLAAAAAPVRVLVVQDVQSRLPLFEL